MQIRISRLFHAGQKILQLRLHGLREAPHWKDDTGDVRRDRGNVSRQRRHRLDPPGGAIHLPGAAGRGQPGGEGISGLRIEEGRQAGDLGDEHRRVGHLPVRHRQGGDHHGEHQPRLQDPRAVVCPQAVGDGGPLSHRPVQDLRLRRHVPRDLPGIGGGRARQDLLRESALPQDGCLDQRGGEAGDAHLGGGPEDGRRGRRRPPPGGAGEPRLRRPHQHPVHLRDDRLPQRRRPHPPQHPE